jgi:hypothetical protein
MINFLLLPVKRNIRGVPICLLCWAERSKKKKKPLPPKNPKTKPNQNKTKKPRKIMEIFHRELLLSSHIFISIEILRLF